MARVGLIVNPAAGRDVRRLAGSAVVSDNYAKQRTAAAVLAGLAIGGPDLSVRAMPDRAGLAEAAIDDADDGVDAALLDMPTRGGREDTREAADRFRESADAVVVLGGDGTTRDVALAVGDVPIAAVSTGTNNVVPTHVDGTVAGAAAGFVAFGDAPVETVTTAHDMVEVAISDQASDRRRTLRALATAGVVDRPFVGTRAILHAGEFLGGMVSRAEPGDVGLSGIAGALTTHRPDAPGGVLVRLGPPDGSPRAVHAVTVPGVVERVGVREWRSVDDGASATFEVAEGVVSVDGERDVAVTEATVRMRPVASADGPRIVRFDAAMEAAREAGYFEA